MQGKIIFRYGCMNSGKSLQLLALAHSFQECRIPFVIFKSAIDTRDGSNVVHSRALGDRECVTIDSHDNLYKLITNYIALDVDLSWILVDECQFLTPSQVDQLSMIADKYKINVMCYGLKTDFVTNLFPGSRRLLEICDKFEEIKTSCKCGKKAIFNARVDENGNIVTDGEQVEIGGNERYVPMCRECYFKKIRIKNNL